MRPNSFLTWQQAEHDAHAAALALQAELRSPGTLPPDAMFIELRLLRQRASDVLGELMLEYAHESARLRAVS